MALMKDSDVSAYSDPVQALNKYQQHPAIGNYIGNQTQVGFPPPAPRIHMDSVQKALYEAEQLSMRVRTSVNRLCGADLDPAPENSTQKPPEGLFPAFGEFSDRVRELIRQAHSHLDRLDTQIP